jgi:hypothetical protein
MKQTAVEWLYNNLLLNPISNEDIEYNEAVFENAKVLDVQQKNSYSEEEVLDILYKHTEDLLSGKKITLEEWFDNIKKK